MNYEQQPKVFETISTTSGEWLGQRPSSVQYEAFRNLRGLFEPLDSIPEDKRTVAQQIIWEAYAETLWRTYNGPWFQWHKPSLRYQEKFLAKYHAELLAAWNEPLPVK